MVNRQNISVPDSGYAGCRRIFIVILTGAIIGLAVCTRSFAELILQQQMSDCFSINPTEQSSAACVQAVEQNSSGIYTLSLIGTFALLFIVTLLILSIYFLPKRRRRK